jgi:electron transfer flavoprotein alpha subunit
MNILVFVKQIPEISKIQFDPATNRIKRDQVPLIINPFDKRAVEEGIRQKEKHGGQVTVVTMGPPSASEILNSSLRMGADRAILITDPVYAGADTWVTAKVLSAVVAKLKPDIVMLGKYSLDGETSQIPPEVAVLSGYPFKTSVSKLEFVDPKSAIIEQELETGFATYRMTIPFLVSVSEKINRARFVSPSVPDMSSRIEKWSASDTGATVKGSDSPTVVESTERVESFRSVKILSNIEEVADLIRKKIREVSSDPPYSSGDVPSWDIANHAVVVSYNDTRSAFEIAGKLSDLGLKHSFSVIALGDDDKNNIQGMRCNRYIKLNNASIKGFSEYLVRYIKEKKPSYVVFPSSVEGREISSYVAASLSLGLTADCIDLDVQNGKLIQFKPAFGGGMVARITSKSSPGMASVRQGIFTLSKGTHDIVYDEVDLSSSFQEEALSREFVSSEFRPLKDAKTVIGIGKGLVKKENLSKVIELADVLNASIGGSRPIVDLNWIPRQQQIGLTGYSISPKLYIALGVSGHDNHVVGIRYAGTVIAVNKDPQAQIFKFADYGYIGDALQFTEDLTGMLRSS